MVARSRLEALVSRDLNAARRIGSLVATGGAKHAESQSRTWVASGRSAYGLRRGAITQFALPGAKISIEIRPIEPKDVDVAFVQEIENSEGRARMEAMRRYQLLQLGTPTCYVAVTDDDEPCYMQWLSTSEQNDVLQTYFKGLFPVLEPHQALIEMAFTLEKFRRNGIMSEAVARITEQAFDAGAEQVIIFVAVDNIGSLKGCKRAGFTPYTMRTERWRMIRRSISYGSVPEDAPNLDVF